MGATKRTEADVGCIQDGRRSMGPSGDCVAVSSTTQPARPRDGQERNPHGMSAPSEVSKTGPTPTSCWFRVCSSFWRSVECVRRPVKKAPRKRSARASAAAMRIFGRLGPAVEASSFQLIDIEVGSAGGLWALDWIDHHVQRGDRRDPQSRRSTISAVVPGMRTQEVWAASISMFPSASVSFSSFYSPSHPWRRLLPSRDWTPELHRPRRQFIDRSADGEVVLFVNVASKCG